LFLSVDEYSLLLDLITNKTDNNIEEFATKHFMFLLITTPLFLITSILMKLLQRKNYRWSNFKIWKTHIKRIFLWEFDAMFNKLHGKELSYNNLLDVDAALI
jgi:phosphoribosylaminoimidazolecarboxamide formyltransferase/IMP cyclohydrolase